MSGPILIDLEQTANAMPFDALVEALRQQFDRDVETPLRHQHPIQVLGEPEATLLLMPVWDVEGFGGVKLVNVHPGNNTRGIPALSASYLLFDSKTGEHVAFVDGGELTARRTAAASALAADYLCRQDSNSQLLVGAGRVASNLAYAYRAVRPIEQVLVWDINPEFAAKLATQLSQDGFDAVVVSDLEEATKHVDIISCATLASDPLIDGRWLRPGQHLDLIGGFTPDMREADDTAVKRSRVYIDTDAALSEAGDLIRPIENGILSREQIAGDLFSLCRNDDPGRQSNEEITLFKAVGTALEDLAAAALAYKNFSGTSGQQ